jgi:rRNA processing protein Krr1/Pno1
MKRKKTNLIIALKIIEDCIKNKRFHTLAQYIELAWSKYPRLRYLDFRNVRVLEYLKRKEKNEKNNIVRFVKRTVN